MYKPGFNLGDRIGMHKKIFNSVLKAMQKAGAADVGAGLSPEKELQIATCALLLEIAHTDGEFLPEEERKIEAIMREHFSLSEEAFRDIKKLSETQRKGSIDLWHFAKTIKEHYSYPQREKIVEMLWSVIYTDDTLDAHEDYLVHKLATVLHLDHRSLIDAKMQVLRKKRAT